jgi:pre-60S factor REI1
MAVSDFSPERLERAAFDKSSVYNLKRRIASLPPISITIFETQVQTSESGSEVEDKERFERECIACGQYYTSRRTWHTHLKSRNHIQKTIELDLESDGESASLSSLSLHSYDEDSSLEEEEIDPDSTFPDSAIESQATPVLLPGDELRLPSGKILGHRSRARQPRRNPNHTERSPPPRQQLLTESGGEAESSPLPMVTMESKDRRLATRSGTEMSMIGVPELQQRALMAVEKKMEGMATRARNEYQARLERDGNSQKRFRVKSIGKKAGGLEKRTG